MSLFALVMGAGIFAGLAYQSGEARRLPIFIVAGHWLLALFFVAAAFAVMMVMIGYL